MTTRVAVNGFGRMGRLFVRASVERDLPYEVVAINDLASPAALAPLLARDTLFGPLGQEVAVEAGGLNIGGRHIRTTSEREPALLPWAELDVDVVVEASGKFAKREAAAAHLDAGASLVVVSAPCKEADATFVVGVNEDTFDPERHRVVSNASCTTNCLVPMIKVLDDHFGIENGLMTTVHAYTGDQSLVDGIHKDLRRGRAAALNIVPTSTGAARATGLVLADMAGRLDGTAVRVPVADGSLTDLTILIRRNADVEEVNAAFRDAATEGRLAPVLEYSEAPIVSSDIVGSPASCTFDAPLTVTSGRLVKVFGWYDNEWGYANRAVELARLVGQAG